MSQSTLQALLGNERYALLLQTTNDARIFNVPVPELSPDDVKVAWALTLERSESIRKDDARKQYNRGRYAATAVEHHSPLTLSSNE